MKKITTAAFIVFSFMIYSLSLKGKSQTLASSPVAIPISPLIPTPASTVPPATTLAPVAYKDGTYTGDVVDAYYGNVQVQTTIQNHLVTDVQFLNYPQDRQHSVIINSQAMPMLKSEAINAQTANVDIVSGATATSQAFIQSLQSALTKAQG
jgi:uncharacterized protein with FMN-binding domain